MRVIDLIEGVAPVLVFIMKPQVTRLQSVHF